jgi:hypothetical protein
MAIMSGGVSVGSYSCWMMKFWMPYLYFGEEDKTAAE